MGRSTKGFIVRGKGDEQDRILTSWFWKHEEGMAVQLMPSVDESRMRSMWKEAHGLSVPNHAEADEKPKRKRTPKDEATA